MTKPTLRQLHVFAQLVASGSMAACARELDLDPEEIEDEIAALEAGIGHSLFAADRDVIALTAVGRKTVEALQLLARTGFEDWRSDAQTPPVEPLVPIEDQPAERAWVEEEESNSGLITEDLTDRDASTEPRPDETETVKEEPEALLAEKALPPSPPPLTVRTIVARLDFRGIVPARMPMPMVVTPVITGARNDVPPVVEAADATEEAEAPQMPAVAHPAETPEPLAADATAPAIADVAHEEALDLEAVWAFREERDEPSMLVLPTAESEPNLADEDTVGDELLLDAPVEDQPSLEVEPDNPPQHIEASDEIELLLKEPEPPAPASTETPQGQSISELPPTEAEETTPAPIRKSRFRPWRLREEPEPEDNATVAIDDDTADAPVTSDEADEWTIEPTSETRQKVIVAAHPSIFGHFRDALAAFEQGNPDVAISLDLNALTASRAEPMLAKGEADIVYYYAMSELDRLESRYVWSESVSLFIGADHPLAMRDEVTGDDLMAVRAILLGPRNGLRPILDNALRRGGVDLWHPVLESDDITEIAEAVRDNRGFFGAFGPLARDFGKTAGIRRIPFIDPLPPIEVRQAVRPEMANDAVVAALAEYLFR